MSFPVFFAVWALQQGWVVPNFHIRMCRFLEEKGDIAVLLVFRGAAKSTIAAVYEAWKLYVNPKYRFLIQAATDKDATMMTRDCRSVLMRHPDTEGMIGGKVAEMSFFVEGSEDERNPSMRASGILSNITGSRCDECVFDDVEVPKTVETVELREKLRRKISEVTHILVPGGPELYIGTPHAEDSLYDELEANGADILRIPLFSHNQRFEEETDLKQFKVNIPTDDLILFHGNVALKREIDYWIIDSTLIFSKPKTGLIDLYSGNIWPERFTYEEMIKRRKKCKTLNEWDSQYMLRARSLTDSRLNPDLLIPYDVEPEFYTANNELVCKLGGTYITAIKAHWDPAEGKIESDASVLTILLQDQAGNYYAHRAVGLEGDIYAQCEAIKKICLEFKTPNIQIETNGIGGFAPAILRKTLAGTGISVSTKHSTDNKNERIIGAIETPLSGQLLWAHTSVIDGPLFGQMRDWKAKIKKQPDDYLDSLASAILSAPVKLRAIIGQSKSSTLFRPLGKIQEVQYVD